MMSLLLSVLLVAAHQGKYCDSSGTNYPGSDTIQKPWHCYTRSWQQLRPGVTLDICTTCGTVEGAMRARPAQNRQLGSDDMI